jgi:hypothetical protein
MTAPAAAHRPSPRRFALLAVMLLLFLLAQSAALRHDYLWHGVQAAQQSAPVSGEPLPQVGHCDLCLMAAAVHGSAPPGMPPLLADVAAPYAPPLALFTADGPKPPAHPYRSRAPPVSSL